MGDSVDPDDESLEVGLEVAVVGELSVGDASVVVGEGVGLGRVTLANASSVSPTRMQTERDASSHRDPSCRPSTISA